MQRLSPVSQVRKARRHHRFLRSRDPSLAAAVPGAGMVTSSGEVALPLVDGDIALYEVAIVFGFRCRPARDNGPVVETAFDAVVEFDRCVRAHSTLKFQHAAE